MSNEPTNPTEIVSPSTAIPHAQFLTGVVEGFYGRPWTIDQRKRLFHRMKEFKMDVYLYAPKDDSKHRAYWREQYSIEESEVLRELIQASTSMGIRFVYAISPGIDITYSSKKDTQTLKKKLEQVRRLGCANFAILFDDIDTAMQKADAAQFKSFAEAQSHLANELYEHLGEPQLFLFCPTDYCNAMAKCEPEDSDYLKTIGARLLPDIKIMWTGPKVVSKDLSVAHLWRVEAVLRRKALIWDNLHANDYDMKRLYLGPYCLRNPLIRDSICGVLTNPNCEFEANFVPIYTLALWCHSKWGVVPPKEELAENGSDGVGVDFDALVREVDDSVDKCEFGAEVPRVSVHNSAYFYDEKVCLAEAIRRWIAEFYEHRKEETGALGVDVGASEHVGVDMVTSSENIHENAAPVAVQLLSAPNRTIKAKCEMDAVNSLAKSKNAKSNSKKTHSMFNLRHLRSNGVCRRPKPKRKFLKIFHNKKKRAKRRVRERIDGGELFKLRTYDITVNRLNLVKSRRSSRLVYTTRTRASAVVLTSKRLKKSSIKVIARIKKTHFKKRLNLNSRIDEVEPMEVLSEKDYELMSEDLAASETNCAGIISKSSISCHHVAIVSQQQPLASLPSSIQQFSNPSSSSSQLQSHFCTNCLSPMDLGKIEDEQSMAAMDEMKELGLNEKEHLNEIDVKILVDLFYLPFEHGPYALYLLKEFNNLKADCVKFYDETKNEAEEMKVRFKRYENVVRRINTIGSKLYKAYNKQIVAEIGHRFSQLCCTLQSIQAILSWLNFNCIQMKSSDTFYSDLKKHLRMVDVDTNVDQWGFRGGLSAQLRSIAMLEPVDELPLPNVDFSEFKIKNLTDFEMVKSCLLKSKSQAEIDMLALDVYLKISPQFCFVAEFKGEPVAFLFASPHAKDFYEYCENHYLPSMRSKYSSETSLQAESFLQNFCSNLMLKKPSDLVLAQYPSKFFIETLDNQFNLNNSFLIHQLLDILVFTLKSKDSQGAYTSYDMKKDAIEDVFDNLGFRKLPKEARDDEILNESVFYACKFY